MSTAALRVVVAQRPPFVFVSTEAAGPPSFSGLLIDLLERTLAYINSTQQYDVYVSPSNSGGSLVGGVWTGVVGELVYGRADVALFPLTRTAARLGAIDCTYSYLDQGLALLVRDSAKGPGPLSVLAPFETTLWVTLLCTVLGVGIIFWVLDAYGRWIRARQREALRASGVLSDRAAARAGKDDRNHVLISFMAVAGAPERPERANWGVQVLYVFYCFFCLIVLSSYTANLTSFLAVQRAAGGIDGLQDLVRGNMLLGVNPNGSTAAYFASSFDTLAMQLQPNVRYCATDTCVQWLRDGAVSAFVSDQSPLDYLAAQRPCDLAVVGEPFGPGNLVVGLQKNSTLLPLFNAAIQRFAEDGTLSSLYRAWFEEQSQCGDAGSAADSSRLGVAQMLGAFIFLAVGVMVAFVTGTLENLRWCVWRAVDQSQKRIASSLNGMRDGFGGSMGRERVSTFRDLVGRLSNGSRRAIRPHMVTDPGVVPPAQVSLDAYACGDVTPPTTEYATASVAVRRRSYTESAPSPSAAASASAPLPLYGTPPPLELMSDDGGADIGGMERVALVSPPGDGAAAFAAIAARLSVQQQQQERPQQQRQRPPSGQNVSSLAGGPSRRFTVVHGIPQQPTQPLQSVQPQSSRLQSSSASSPLQAQQSQGPAGLPSLPSDSGRGNGGGGGGGGGGGWRVQSAAGIAAFAVPPTASVASVAESVSSVVSQKHILVLTRTGSSCHGPAAALPPPPQQQQPPSPRAVSPPAHIGGANALDSAGWKPA